MSDEDDLLKEFEDALRTEGLLKAPDPMPCKACGATSATHTYYDGGYVSGLYCGGALGCWQHADDAEYAIADGRMTRAEWARLCSERSKKRLREN